MEVSDKHREPKFKAEMLAKYGRETGINPSVAWPTKEQVTRYLEPLCLDHYIFQLL